jgi:tetratricopeptide (TPR) repeat protein
LAIEPRLRPTSYTEILAALEHPFEYSCTPEQESERLLNLAKVFRESGAFDESIRLLKILENEHPQCRALALNAQGATHVRNGRSDEAEECFNDAIKFLREQGPIVGSWFFIAPVPNLARLLLTKNLREEALALLKEAWEWIKAIDDSDGTIGDAPEHYSEFGWMLLMEGDFESATRHLEKCLSTKSADETQLCWLLYSAWMTKRFCDFADAIAPIIDAAGELGNVGRLGVSLASAFMPQSQRTNTFRRAIERREEWALQVRKQYGADLWPPRYSSDFESIANALAEFCTTGHEEIVLANPDRQS